MLKKLSMVVLVLALVFSINAGVMAQDDVTEIQLLIGKPEVAKQLEEMVGKFNQEKDDINLELIPLAGQNAYQKMTAMYSSGNAATIINMGGEIDEFGDRLLDLSDMKIADYLVEGTAYTYNDKLVALPLTVEAFGLIYNKDVIEDVFGSDYDISKVNTRKELEEVFKEIKAADGVAPVTLSPMDWSLGAHLTNIMFTTQSAESSKRHQFLDSMKKGEVDLVNNKQFDGWLKTFDLIKEYNLHQSSPLSPTYDDAVMELANGEAAFWFMGNWALPQLNEVNAEAEYGFLPYPISNNPDDYGNNKISVGVPSYWVIDKSQSTEAEQEAAKEFLTWLVTSETGQDYYINQLNFIPAFDNFEISPQDNLSNSIIEYMNKGNTLEWMNNYYPSGYFPEMGSSLQKYLAGYSDKEQLAEEFMNLWQE
ncbi:ABC transporter substrate-binding protein [Halanaerobium kushneri]|uniref:Carbohydrate ABC transporter substrate-binding protein, CUT1 family n=1 Tax=Halanaerobium kushneri TaxID=56779 RepID=A0A1N6WNQ4_9FIRM|nr:ABC transporter substrate-binding protein [Halanaerobium kushneri]SIQ91651.1 carbohydrate ABC transporter substrate-binding protein, CUT1 family [Halanaerobium kushneri]